MDDARCPGERGVPDPPGRAEGPLSPDPAIGRPARRCTRRAPPGRQDGGPAPGGRRASRPGVAARQRHVLRLLRCPADTGGHSVSGRGDHASESRPRAAPSSPLRRDQSSGPLGPVAQERRGSRGLPGRGHRLGFQPATGGDPGVGPGSLGRGPGRRAVILRGPALLRRIRGPAGADLRRESRVPRALSLDRRVPGAPPGGRRDSAGAAGNRPEASRGRGGERGLPGLRPIRGVCGVGEEPVHLPGGGVRLDLQRRPARTGPGA